jgi:HK97 family phage portal protein
MPQWLDNILDRAIGRLGYMKASDVPISVAFAGEAPPDPLVNFGGFTDEQRERLAITSAWVYSDIRAIANEGSGASIGIHRSLGQEKTEEIVDHPFERLMRRPNGFMSGDWLKQYTLWWWLLRGEAYWWKVFDLSGELKQLWPIPSTRMKPIPDRKKYIRGYVYFPRHGQKAKELPPEQVCFFRFPNPFDFHRGLAPLTAYRLALETDTAAVRWNRDTFNQGGALQMLISLPADLGKVEFTRRKAEIVEELVEKQRRFMIGRAGDIKAEQLSVSHKDLEFLAGREFTREEIDRVFGIPAGYWAKDANRANAEAAKATMIEQAVWPLLKLMHGDITAQIIIPHYGEDLLAQFDDVRPRDRRLQLSERKQAETTQTVNEARAARGEPEYAGPLADTIGELPVPLATNAQFVMAMEGLVAGLGGLGGSGGGIGANGKAMREDLRRWRGIALRRLRDGEDPAGYDFESEHIGDGVKAEIGLLLATAETETEVKAAFAAPFRAGGQGRDHGGNDWSGYP